MAESLTTSASYQCNSPDPRPVIITGANGDLGRGLLKELDQAAVPSVAVARTLHVNPALHHPELRQVVTMPTLAASCADLKEVISNAKIIINCAGMAHFPADSPTILDRSFEANVLFALSLSILAEASEIPIIHPSTGLLDYSESSNSLSNAEQSAIDILRSKLPPSVALERVTDELTKRTSINERNTHLSQKLMLERLLNSSMTRSHVLRISNFFGPGCVKPYLIPKIIESRIRGKIFPLADQWMNYSYVDELNNFLLTLITHADSLPGPIIWAYGQYDVTCSMIAEEINHALPSCYGGATIMNASEKSAVQAIPAVPRISDYFPYQADTSIEFRDAILRTTEFWRSIIRFDPIDFVIPNFSPTRISGGSVAAKHLSNGQGSVFTKSASMIGYEGAGAPKLAAELEFYQTMPKKLRALYPAYLGGIANSSEVHIILAGHGDGRTVADTVVDGEGVPEALIRELVSKAFTAGYLNGIRTIDSRSLRESHLCSYYIDRTVGRLHSMLALLRHEQLEEGESNLFRLLEEKERIHINGQLCANPIGLLEGIRIRPNERLLVRSEGPCSHGDMTILNMLWTREEKLLLIDPRGMTGYWDPAYDLGKLAFSLSGFAHCIKGRLTWGQRHSSAYYIDDMDGTLASTIKSRRQLNSWLLDADRLSPLRRIEPFLNHRVAFAEATHYLADTPYRYAQGRDITRTVVTLLLGIRYLHDAYLGEIQDKTG